MGEVSENMYSVKFQLSLKEMNEAVGAIKVHAIEEKVKGYLPIKIIGVLLMLSLSVIGLTTIIVVVEAWTLLDKKLIVYIWLGAVCFAVAISALKDSLFKYYLKKNEPAEQNDQLKMKTISLLERGISQRQEDYENIAYWSVFIQVHEQDGFIYIRQKNNRFIVIPVRVFPDEASKEKFLTKLKSYIHA